MIKKKKIAALLIVLMILCKAEAQHNYSLYKTIPVGDEQGWDYIAVDEINQHVFFSHATKVLVGSVEKDSIIGEIPNTLGVHGIAFDQELNRGFISNGKANSVTVFDLKTFKVIDTVAVSGVNPDAIMYDPFSKKIFTFNGRSDNSTVIDPVSLKIVATITLPGKPEFAVTDLKGNVYVNLEDKSELVHINTNNFTVVKTWSVAPGEEPSGLAIDRENNVLFSGCANKKIIVFDLTKEMVIDSVSIGGKVDAIVFDLSTKMVYSSNGEGNVTIVKQVNATTYKTIQVLQTQKGCKTMALDEKTKKIYLPAASFVGDTRKIVDGTFKILVFK
ncbi:MAG: YncE family protein [Bacteroidetes bacterium]|nr:YncE family protein [Bacteroidota bacterium]